MYKKHKKYKKNISKSRGFRGPFEGVFFITFLAAVMVVLIVAMLKSNVERIPKNIQVH